MCHHRGCGICALAAAESLVGRCLDIAGLEEETGLDLCVVSSSTEHHGEIDSFSGHLVNIATTNSPKTMIRGFYFHAIFDKKRAFPHLVYSRLPWGRSAIHPMLPDAPSNLAGFLPSTPRSTESRAPRKSKHQVSPQSSFTDLAVAKPRESKGLVMQGSPWTNFCFLCPRGWRIPTVLLSQTPENFGSSRNTLTSLPFPGHLLLVHGWGSPKESQMWKTISLQRQGKSDHLGGKQLFFIGFFT